MFRIRATVRDKNNFAKMEPLIKAFGDLYASVEFVNADLTDEQSLDKAIQGSDFVVHTASPVGRNPNNHEDMIRPAVDGVLAVMKACQKYKVKRVVITSSVAAVSHPARDDEVDEYDETCWSNPAACEFSAYIKSKTLAERAAWDFNAAAKKKGEFCVELVTICPSLIIGEMIGSGDSTSISLVRQVMMGEIPALPQLYFSCVDVHDCSKAHLRALIRPEAANRRFILSRTGNSSMEEIGTNLRDDLISIGKDYPVTTRVIGYCTVKFLSWFSSDISSVLPLVNRRVNHVNNASMEVLGIEYSRATREFTLAAAVSMIQNGVVPDKVRQ